MVDLELVSLVERVHALPYGRPRDRTVEGMWREGRGTCSTKHLYLARELAHRCAELAPQLVHRVYRIDRETAARRFGDRVAATVPEAGLVDVHRYLTILLDQARAIIDVTFPGPPWDGLSSMPLACGEGEDHLAGHDPDHAKRELERLHCQPALREPFIAALAAHDADAWR